ncbi:MAG: hypothetical protein ACLUGS_13245, partial [Alistipes putredinis]
MNSIILIAACAVCLDQLFFRGRLASYVVDNLKGPKKNTPGITLPLTRRMPVLHPVKLLKFS